MAKHPEVKELFLFGDVLGNGIVLDDMWNAVDFPKLLKKHEDDDIEILVDSPGGDVFGGFSIMNLIARRKKKTTITIVGLAASITSNIAMAADVLQMAKGTQLMIHNSNGGVRGNSRQIRGVADILDKIDASQVSIYTDKIESNNKLIGGNRKKTEAKIESLVNAETWLTAKEALDLGLIDKMVDGRKDITPIGEAKSDIQARYTACLGQLKNIPDSIQAKYNIKMEKSTEENKEEAKGFFAFLYNMFTSHKKEQQATPPTKIEPPKKEAEMTNEQIIAAAEKLGYTKKEEKETPPVVKVVAKVEEKEDSETAKLLKEMRAELNEMKLKNLSTPTGSPNGKEKVLTEDEKTLAIVGPEVMASLKGLAAHISG